jgi:hypothetical protein
MMIRSNGEFFDFDGDIEIESRIKLFDEVGSSNGDFSYDIELPNTAKNRKILGIPVPDSVKTIYTDLTAEIINDQGELVYTGKLQVNKIAGQSITATFYAGNTEWFSLLSDPLSSLPLYRYDVELTEANITASWAESSGIVFPIIDSGVLVNRSFANFKVEDFVPFFYVKTLFQEIFNPLGIKLTGDLLDDPMYNSIGVVCNGRSQDDVISRSCFIEKTTQQLGLPTSVYNLITFQNESIFPYFDGASDNFSTVTSRYTSDLRMRVTVDISLITNNVIFGISLFVNGNDVMSWVVSGLNPIIIKLDALLLEPGDFLEVKTYSDPLSVDVLSGSLKITPTYIYFVSGKSSVPFWTQGKFVSNILSLFNVLPSYEATSKTLTLNLFKDIATKEAIDISDAIEITEIDFSEFVQDFSKKNIFTYQEGDDEDLRIYNISNYISYGSGALLIENDFIDNEDEILESDFTTPITYLNGVFDTSMERIPFVEVEEIESRNITSVSDSSGTARFNISNADDYFEVSDLVEIETDVTGYNGQWVIQTVSSSYIEVRGGDYISSTTGTAKLMRHKFTTDKGVYLFANIPNMYVAYFSSRMKRSNGLSVGHYYFEQSNKGQMSLAYFNMLSNGQEVNSLFKQGLSFGSIDNPLSYQKSILDTYWPNFSKMLNDPVMVRANGYFQRLTFDQMRTFLRPLRVKTNETNNLYYLNRVNGYKDSGKPCEIELIKL